MSIATISMYMYMYVAMEIYSRKVTVLCVLIGHATVFIVTCSSLLHSMVCNMPCLNMFETGLVINYWCELSQVSVSSPLWVVNRCFISIVSQLSLHLCCESVVFSSLLWVSRLFISLQASHLFISIVSQSSPYFVVSQSSFLLHWAVKCASLAMVFSDYTKQRILFYHGERKPPVISHLLDKEGIQVSRRSILNFLKRCRSTGTLAQKPGSEGRTKITAKMKRFAKEKTREDDETTAILLHHAAKPHQAWLGFLLQHKHCQSPFPLPKRFNKALEAAGE